VRGPVDLERPADGVPLRELSGQVAGAPGAVFAALVAKLDTGEGSTVDPATRRFVVQGGYWYRGEYTVEDAAVGAVVRLTIVNVAPGWKLFGALTGRSVLRSAPREFSALLADLDPAQRST
jgi:hypothetical protein